MWFMMINKVNMKKIILGFGLLLGASGIAQNNIEKPVEEKGTITLLSSASHGSNLQVGFELPIEKGRVFGLKYSTIIQLGYSQNTKTLPGLYDIQGNAFIGSYGVKLYLNKNKVWGWNIQNSIEAATYKYDDPNYSGKYSYVSLVNPEIGYKVKMKNFVLEPQLGFSWAYELDDKGDVNNDDFDDVMPKLGLRAGYMF